MDVIADKQNIGEVVARYADLCDQGDWEGVVGLFEKDAVFDAEKVYGKTVTGADELRAFFEAAPVAAGHHPTSFYSVVDGDHATTRMKMIVLFKSGIFSVAYDWELNRSDDDWKIARQTISVVGKVPVPQPVDKVTAP